MKMELSSIQDEKKDLMRRKAEYETHIVHVDCLLELIQEMKKDPGDPSPAWVDDGNRFGSYYPEVQRQVEAYDPSCSDPTDFFERTTEHHHSGPITEYDNEDVIRYIDQIIVHQDRMEVVFKAGVRIDIMK